MRDPRERLLDMLEAIERIERHAAKGRAEFELVYNLAPPPFLRPPALSLPIQNALLLLTSFLRNVWFIPTGKRTWYWQPGIWSFFATSPIFLSFPLPTRSPRELRCFELIMVSKPQMPSSSPQPSFPPPMPF